MLFTKTKHNFEHSYLVKLLDSELLKRIMLITYEHNSIIPIHVVGLDSLDCLSQPVALCCGYYQIMRFLALDLIATVHLAFPQLTFYPL